MTRRVDAALNAVAVSPSTGPLPSTTRALMVTSPGNVEVTFAGSSEEPGNTVVLPGLQPGAFYPVQVERILPGGTTAGGIVALW